MISGAPAYDVHAINNSGQMTADGPGTNADFFLSPGQAPVEITGPHVTGTVALALNDNGIAVGYAQVDSSSANHAFVWSKTTGLVDLTPTLRGYDFASAQAINDEGQIVGYEDISGGSETAFLYENGTFYDLSTLLGDSGAGWSDLCAEAINDTGQIAGYGFVDGQEEGFLLTPDETSGAVATGTPEPTTFGILSVGVMLLVRRRREFMAP